jgi:hypothetical protein
MKVRVLWARLVLGAPAALDGPTRVHQTAGFREGSVEVEEQVGSVTIVQPEMIRCVRGEGTVGRERTDELLPDHVGSRDPEAARRTPDDPRRP